jgi:hypothetical protein
MQWRRILDFKGFPEDAAFLVESATLPPKHSLQDGARSENRLKVSPNIRHVKVGESGFGVVEGRNDEATLSRDLVREDSDPVLVQGLTSSRIGGKKQPKYEGPTKDAGHRRDDPAAEAQRDHRTHSGNSRSQRRAGELPRGFRDQHRVRLNHACLEWSKPGTRN